MNCCPGTGPQQELCNRRLPDGSHDQCLHHHACCQDAGRKPGIVGEIASNDDNLDYGDIVTIWTGDEETITSFTDDGIDSLRAFIRDVRTWPGGIHQFLTGSLWEPDVIERIMSDEPKT